MKILWNWGVIIINNSCITWREEWVISQYESPWGILEKFKKANQADDNDIFNLFGAEKAKLNKTKSWGKTTRELVTLGGLDSKSLKNILGYDLKAINNSNLEKILGLFTFSHKNIFLRENLHFCRDCLYYGYHSIFHQLNFIDKCPHHNRPLESKCPKCGLKIPYEINSRSKYPKPFGCSCGYILTSSYNDDYGYMKKWTRKINLDIKILELKRLLSLTSDQINLIKRIYFHEDFYKRYQTNFLKFILDIVDGTNEPVNNLVHYKIKTNKNIFKIIDYKSIESNHFYQGLYGNFRPNVFQICENTYKTVMKHLRNTVFKKHKGCLKSLQTKIFLKEYISKSSICPYAYIYILIRKSVESFNQLWEIDRKAWPGGKKTVLILPIEEDRVLRDFFYVWRERLKETNFNSEKGFNWVVNRLIFIFIYSFYLHLLENNETIIENGISDDEDFSFIKNAPFFVVVFPEKSSDSVELHYWLDYKKYVDQLEVNLKCPNESIKKKRKSKASDLKLSNILFK